MNKAEIYYFSGTGNSLHVAKELQKRIPDSKLIPIVSLLNKDIIETNAETVGFVFPTHGMTVPIPVKKFIEKLELPSTQYIFAAATRGCTKCFAFSKINKILKRKGKALDSCFVLSMPSNDPKFEVYEIPTKDNIAENESKIRYQIDAMADIILGKRISREEDTDCIQSGFLLDRLVLLAMKYAEYDGAKDYFYCDSKCTGCGTCEKVCPSGKIEMVGDKPIWKNSIKCYLCYACINYCPKQAAQINNKWYMKSYTAKNGRYPHPYAAADDIAGQKQSRQEQNVP